MLGQCLEYGAGGLALAVKGVAVNRADLAEGVEERHCRVGCPETGHCEVDS